MKQEKRRDFLKKGLAAGVTTLAGTTAILSNKEKVTESGDKVKLLSPDGELVEVDKTYLKLQTHSKAEELAKQTNNYREGIPGRKFVMVIDLAKCRNALKCVIACQKMHHLSPDKEWLKVRLMKDSEFSSPYWFPKCCFHCDNPPCVKVCPVNATFKRTDGLVLIDTERCIGCKFCMAACPYSTRVFNWGHPDLPKEISEMESTPETSVPSISGTVEKCDFCPDMIRMGKLPDCATSCPNGVFYFGDENEDTVTNGDETLRFKELIRDKAGYRYAEELGTKPRVYYLPPTDRMFPVERGFEKISAEEMLKYKEMLDGENL